MGTIEQELMAEVDRATRTGEPIETPAAKRLFGAYVAENHARLVSFCRSQKVADPEDLAQVAWGIAWRRIHTFERRASLWAWVRGIARNRCANARAKMKERLTDDGLLDPGSEEVAVLRQLQHEEREALLLEAVKVLPTLDQDVVWMKWRDGYSHARIAELMEPVRDATHVKAIVERSKRHLRDELRRRLRLLDESTSWIRSFTGRIVRKTR